MIRLNRERVAFSWVMDGHATCLRAVPHDTHMPIWQKRDSQRFEVIEFTPSLHRGAVYAQFRDLFLDRG
jgi:hypothetical protein